MFAEDALKFVRDHKDGPFFLDLSFTIPHANDEAGDKGMEVPSLGEYANLDWPEPQKGIAAMITRMDGDVGRLLALLKELKIDENTLVIFTSDNGPHKEGGNNPDFNDSNGPLTRLQRQRDRRRHSRAVYCLVARAKFRQVRRAIRPLRLPI